MTRMTPEMAKEGRRLLAATVRTNLRNLAPGSALTVDLPADEPHRQASYRTVKSVSQRVLGTGGRYQIRIDGPQVIVKRLL